MKLWKRILIGFVLKIFFDERSEPKSVHKGSSKTHLDTIQFLVEKTSAIDLDVSSFDNT
jgi:hypothetical protein